jgi:hypothetical protein
MSWLSDIVRATTGRSVGETAGQAIGTAIGGPVGGAFGSKIGGATTKALSKASSGSQQGQSVAIDSTPTPPAETAQSGEAGGYNMSGIQPAVFRSAPPAPGGGYGNVQRTGAAALPAIIGGGTAVARGMGGMLMLGGGAIAVAPTIIDMFGNEKKLRVTRRLRSQVKRAVEMFGVEAVADQMGTDVEVIFYILTKKMRNDGPYVTKAAVRKTRQTVRKMKHLCDMYDDLRPAAKRRAPTRTTSRVTQIKN